MLRRLTMLMLAIVALGVAGYVSTAGELTEVLEPLIRPGVSAELDKGCESEYAADERYTLAVQTDRAAYLTVFLFLSDGRTLLEFPFRGFTERRPPPLEAAVDYEVPTDWLIAGPGRFFIPRPVGECAIVAIASEERLAISYSTTRCWEQGVSQWLITLSHAEAVDVILSALSALSEGSWWAGTACFFTFVAIEPSEDEEAEESELPADFFLCP
ncbi:hypothetical protein ACFLTM_05095 [Candidatus Bipolaricaulota bacterium]